MLDFLLDLSFVLYLAASAGLLAFGLNSYVMLALFARRSKENSARQRRLEAEWKQANLPLPKVTTQLPLYNELNVAERAIRAVAAFDYPRDLHQIQILDDSNDGTREIVDRVAAELFEKGIRIKVVRRQDRSGYKAGALAHGMASAEGEFIAIFDSDFVPAPDFLRALLPHFKNENTGLVQARWGHLNRSESLLTRAQAMGIDGHFGIEQTARSANHLFLNFNGTAGIWRRRAIEDAGGWTADTLTEDLDLSYRAQLKDWHLEFVPHVVVPAELPETYSAFKSQQFRWAKGSIQTAIKLIPAVFASRRSPLAKLQSVFHLCNYGAHPLMLAVALLALPARHYLGSPVHSAWLIFVFVPLLFSTCGPAIFYLVSQRHLYPGDWRGRALLLPMLMLVGFGICISNTRAVLEAIFGIKSGFIRTPKRGSSPTGIYHISPDRQPLLEIAAGLYSLVTLVFCARAGHLGMLPFLVLNVAGFGLVGWSSWSEQRRKT